MTLTLTPSELYGLLVDRLIQPIYLKFASLLKSENAHMMKAIEDLTASVASLTAVVGPEVANSAALKASNDKLLADNATLASDKAVLADKLLSATAALTTAQQNAISPSDAAALSALNAQIPTLTQALANSTAVHGLTN
jgi:antitoxin component of RelBE/YafQ-DinJ toxin-antitoxin module